MFQFPDGLVLLHACLIPRHLQGSSTVVSGYMPTQFARLSTTCNLLPHLLLLEHLDLARVVGHPRRAGEQARAGHHQRRQSGLDPASDVAVQLTSHSQEATPQQRRPTPLLSSTASPARPHGFGAEARRGRPCKHRAECQPGSRDLARRLPGRCNLRRSEADYRARGRPSLSVGRQNTYRADCCNVSRIDSLAW